MKLEGNGLESMWKDESCEGKKKREGRKRGMLMEGRVEKKERIERIGSNSRGKAERGKACSNRRKDESCGRRQKKKEERRERDIGRRWRRGE